MRTPVSRPAFLPILLWLTAALLYGACSSPAANSAPEPSPTATESPTVAPEETRQPPPSPTARPSVPGLLEPVSKSFSLGSEYVPQDLVELTEVPVTRPGVRLRQVACEPLKRMLSDARGQGLAIMVLSGYRSFDEQAVIHAAAIRASGEAEASRYSARPGHSEHQLGTTVDFTSPAVHYDLVEAFGLTPEGRWLRDNAHRYGFLLSYPEGKEEVTGYMYEPWHYRYVGEETAAAVLRAGVTLHEYLNGRH